MDLAVRINTVNVIEILETTTCQIGSFASFPESPEGNKAAEELFRSICKETASSTSDEDLYCYTEDGYCEVGEGAVLLVHSSSNAARITTKRT